jgi:hypothetical protein
MLGWIREIMATQELAPGGDKFSAFGLIAVGNGASTYNNSCTVGWRAYNGPCALGKDYSTTAGNDF